MCPLILSASGGAAFRPRLGEVGCMPRRLCVGAQGFVAFGNVQRWGGEFPLEVPPGVPQGFDQRFPQRSPQRFPQSPPKSSPKGLPAVFPRGAPKGSSKVSLWILNLRLGLFAEASVLYLLLRHMLLSRAQM